MVSCEHHFAGNTAPPGAILEEWLAGKDTPWPPLHEHIDSHLRFSKETRVECCVGKNQWLTGTVVALWYSEPDFPSGFFAPYQVQLDDDRLIFAPDDSDRCIRIVVHSLQ